MAGAERGSNADAGFVVVRHVPEWFPGAGFKTQARIWHAAIDKLFNNPYSVCQKRLVSHKLYQTYPGFKGKI